MNTRILLGGVAALFLLVLTVETGWVSVAASEVRSSFPADTRRVEPGTNQLQASEGPLELLAVGDLAECPAAGGLSSAFPETAYLLGMKSGVLVEEDNSVQTARLAERYPEATLLALGDLVYRSGSNAEFDLCYDPTWGKLRGRTLPTPGNHEYRTFGAHGYFDYWKERAGPDRLGYYARRHGNWLLLSLNSEIPAVSASAQGRWLGKTLDAAPEACILAFYHKPAYSMQRRSGSDEARALFRTLQEAGATLVLSGHNHFYERSAPLDAEGRRNHRGGTIEFTVGTGGKTSRPIARLDTTDAAIFGTQGMLRLVLRDGSFEWSFLSAEDGLPLDEGQGTCNPARQLLLTHNM